MVADSPARGRDCACANASIHERLHGRFSSDSCRIQLCQNREMNRFSKSLGLSAVVLLLTTHRLPAPIQEVLESPTPAPEQSAKPKPKPKQTIKPKVTSESSESSTKRPTSSPQPRNQTTQQRNAFDGTWVGTQNQGSFGDIQLTQVISGSGTVVRSTSKLGTFIWNATCDGKTMQWSVNTKYGSGVRTFTPKPDGKTGLMTFESGAFHSSATFYKTSA